jgi:hypothetical protein
MMPTGSWVYSAWPMNFKCTHVNDLYALDKGNIISSNRRTNGKWVDYTDASDIACLENDNESKSDSEGEAGK